MVYKTHEREGLMKYIKFELSMPKINTWNGQWSGKDREFFLIKNVSEKDFDEKLIGSWSHDFGDGWAASIKSKLVGGDELSDCRKKIREGVVGFLGYEWMVSDILNYGGILKSKEREKLEANK